MRIFHVSERPDITLFQPRSSPSYFADIKGDVVFAIADRLLHNYLLPRDCPRVTWYAGPQTTDIDKHHYNGNSDADYTIVVESGWYQRIKDTVLYCYELPVEGFKRLDECAGYYIAYKSVEPLIVTPIYDIMSELLTHNVELRFTPSLLKLADEVSKSSLNFSLIRMRNAVGR